MKKLDVSVRGVDVGLTTEATIEAAFRRYCKRKVDVTFYDNTVILLLDARRYPDFNCHRIGLPMGAVKLVDSLRRADSFIRSCVDLELRKMELPLGRFSIPERFLKWRWSL